VRVFRKLHYAGREILIGLLVFSSLTVLAYSPVCYAQDEVITLTYWNWTARETEMPWERELITKFEAEHPNIKINLVVNPYHEHHDKILRATMVGQAPDVFQLIPERLVGFIKLGVIRPIDDLVTPELVGEFVPSAWDLAVWDGVPYGLPWRYGCSAMYVNLDLFEEAGLELPQDPSATEITWTWEDLYRIAKQLKERLPNKWGFGFSGDVASLGTSWEWFGFFFQAGGKLIEDGKAGINSPAGAKALEFYVRLYREGLVPEGTLGLWDKDLCDLLGRGEVAMWQNGPWWVSTLKTMYPETHFTTIMLPKGVQDGSSAGGTLLGISPQTKHLEAAWTFIKYMASNEILGEWSRRGFFMPTKLALLKADWLQEPPMRAFVEQAKQPHTTNQATLPEAEVLYEYLHKAIQKVLLGEATPQAALGEAAAAWNEILAKYEK